MSRWTKERLKKAVKNNSSIAGTLRDMGVKATGGNYRQFHKYRRIYKIDIEHFKGQGHLKGKSHNWNNKRPLEEILVKNSNYLNSSHLRQRILDSALLKYECAWCGLTEWRDKKLVLHLDHINGINNDNRLENLRFLCPNCHSQTSTYAGKNRKTGQTKNLCDDCDSPCSTGAKRCINCHHENLKKSSVNSALEPNFCKDCNIEVSQKATRCKSCAGKNCQETKIEWPSISTLIELVERKNYSAVARELGVSDNAVRKRIKRLNEGILP